MFPAYAKGALLIGGAAVGVLAPFFMFLLRADETFTAAAFIASFLLLPTIPPVVGLPLPDPGRFHRQPAHSLSAQLLFLALCLLLPFAAAKAAWEIRSGLAKGMLRHHYGISVVCAAGSMLVIFSRFAEPLRQNPSLIPQGLAVLLFVPGLATFARRDGERRLAGVVGFCAVNDVLMAIMAAHFFGAEEVLICPLYSVPFYILLAPYRRLDARLRKAGRGPA